MIEENAVVVATEGEFAWLETERKNTCGSCAVRKGCGTGVLAHVVGRKLNRVMALNPVGARPGERVIVGIDEQSLVRGSLAVYAVPLLALFLVALAGETWWGEPGAMLGGLLGLLAGLAWLRGFSRRCRTDLRFQPVILRRTGAAVPPPAGVLPL